MQEKVPELLPKGVQNWVPHLQACLFSNKISFKLKIRVFQALISSIFLSYGLSQKHRTITGCFLKNFPATNYKEYEDF